MKRKSCKHLFIHKAGRGVWHAVLFCFRSIQNTFCLCMKERNKVVICLFCGQLHFFPSVRSSVLQGAGPCKLPSNFQLDPRSGRHWRVCGRCEEERSLDSSSVSGCTSSVPQWQWVPAVVAAGRSGLQWCWLLRRQQQPGEAVGSSDLCSSRNSIRRFGSRCRLQRSRRVHASAPGGTSVIWFFK